MVDDPEKTLVTRVTALNEFLVQQKKQAALTIAIDREMNDVWRNAVQEVARRGRDVLEAARAEDFSRTDALYAERAAAWNASVKARHEACVAREAIITLKLALKAANALIETLKRKRTILMSPHPRHATGLSDGQPAVPAALGTPPPPRPTLDPPVPQWTSRPSQPEVEALEDEAARVDAENDRLTRLYEELRSWPLILKRVAGCLTT